LRGGSFNNNDNNLHASNRNNNNPTNENNNIGFRVSEAPENQAAQACGQIRMGGQSHAAVPCSGTTRPSGVSVARRAGKEEGPAVANSRKAKGAAGPPFPFESIGVSISASPPEVLCMVRLSMRRSCATTGPGDCRGEGTPMVGYRYSLSIRTCPQPMHRHRRRMMAV
jgi:hypothetical protein